MAEVLTPPASIETLNEVSPDVSGVTASLRLRCLLIGDKRPCLGISKHRFSMSDYVSGAVTHQVLLCFPYEILFCSWVDSLSVLLCASALIYERQERAFLPPIRHMHRSTRSEMHTLRSVFSLRGGDHHEQVQLLLSRTL